MLSYLPFTSTIHRVASRRAGPSKRRIRSRLRGSPVFGRVWPNDTVPNSTPRLSFRAYRPLSRIRPLLNFVMAGSGAQD